MKKSEVTMIMMRRVIMIIVKKIKGIVDRGVVDIKVMVSTYDNKYKC